MESDENDFNRWESGQIISRTLISNAAKLIVHNNSPDPGKPLECYTKAIKNSLNNTLQNLYLIDMIFHKLSFYFQYLNNLI